ncbi:MAG: hypothetical protein V3V37_08170 [Candidatus Adiutricales bacterium]
MSEVKPGIYLEIKKTKIGSGSTSQNASFRNFWITDFQEDETVKITLLNDEFTLTGLNEIITADQLASDRFTYVPEGEKRYQALLEELKRKDSTPQKGVASKEHKKKTDEQETQESVNTNIALGFLGAGNPEKDVKPGDFFNRSPSSKKPKKPAIPSKKSWWNT